MLSQLRITAFKYFVASIWTKPGLPPESKILAIQVPHSSAIQPNWNTFELYLFFFNKIDKG